ncbi:hypothetical protein BC628DRAFT_204762 [Trametes gibbosa]|nr:hypothetical protein BC628DRAFT_204762 [Trametes gibbosa]
MKRSRCQRARRFQVCASHRRYWWPPLSQIYIHIYRNDARDTDARSPPRGGGGRSGRRLCVSGCGGGARLASRTLIASPVRSHSHIRTWITACQYQCHRTPPPPSARGRTGDRFAGCQGVHGPLQPRAQYNPTSSVPRRLITAAPQPPAPAPAPVLALVCPYFLPSSFAARPRNSAERQPAISGSASRSRVLLVLDRSLARPTRPGRRART